MGRRIQMEAEGQEGKGVTVAEWSGDYIFQIPSQMGFRQVSGSWATVAHLLSWGCLPPKCHQHGFLYFA